MRVLFIIPVLARCESDERLLKRCLESIKRHDPGMLPHTLIVEEFFSRGVSWVKDYGCQYFQKCTDPNYAASVNLGMRFAIVDEYSHVVTINQDVELVQSILPAFMRAFLYGDIVGGTLFYPSGRIQSASWFYSEDGDPLEIEKQYFQAEGDAWKGERYVGGITGALQGISLSMGLFYDEKFSLSYEDVSFCVEALLLGHRIFYTPSICAVHVESATRGYFVGEKELTSYKYYKKKHEGLDGETLNRIVEAYNKEHEQRLEQR